MKKQKTHLLPLILSIVLFSIQIVSSSGMAAEQSLESLIEQALENNPGLKAMAGRVSAAETRFDQVTDYPDPKVSVSYSNVPVDSFQLNETPMSGLQFNIAQKITWPKKLSLQGDIAQAMTLIRKEQKKAAALDIRKGVQYAYYDLLYLANAIIITKKNIELLKDYNEIATSRYIVGKGIQSDLIKVQVEISKLESQLISFRQKYLSSETELKTWLNTPSDGKIDVSPAFELTELTLSLSQGIDLLTQSNLILHQLAIQHQLSEKKEARAKLEYYPDFQVNAGYRYRDNSFPLEMNSDDLFSVTLGVVIPLFNRSKRAGIAEHRYEQDVLINEQENARRMLIGGLENALNLLAKNRNLIHLFTSSLIPQAEQSLSSAQSAYQVNEIDFLALLDNQITLFNLEIQLYRLKSDHEKAIASIEYIVGQTTDQIKRIIEKLPGKELS